MTNQDREMTPEPEVNSLWEHRYSKHKYRVRGFCTIEATLQTGVLYRSDVLTGDVFSHYTWCRPLSEFMDGRFRLIEEAAKAED